MKAAKWVVGPITVLLLTALLLAACGQDGPQNAGQPGGFEAILEQPQITVVRGGVASLALTLESLGGYEGAVEVSLLGAPDGMTLVDEVIGLNAGAPRMQSLSVQITDEVPAAIYSLQLQLDSGQLQQRIPFVLAVELPAGAEIDSFSSDRTGLPSEGGTLLLSWSAKHSVRYTIEVSRPDGIEASDVEIDNEPYSGAVMFPAGTNHASLSLPGNPKETDSQAPYQVTLTAFGATGTAPDTRTIGLIVGGADRGSLTIVVEGLPTGVQGAVEVTGMDIEPTPVGSTITLVDLVPGPYDLAADDVEHEGTIYGARLSTARAGVESGEVVTVTATYAPLSPTLLGFTASPLTLPSEGGEVELSWVGSGVSGYLLESEGVKGLPTGVLTEEGITVTLPPNNSDDHRDSYVFTLTALDEDGVPHVSAQQTVTVGPLTSGRIGLTVKGVPAHTSAFPQIVIEASDEMGATPPVAREYFDGNYYYEGVPPGSYKIVAPQFLDEFGNEYEAKVLPEGELTVTSNGELHASVTYHAKRGTLIIAAQGVPAGAVPQFTAYSVESGELQALAVQVQDDPSRVGSFAAPGSFSSTANLEPGLYEVHSAMVEGSDGFLYQARISGQVDGLTRIEAGKLTELSAAFLPVSGAIDLQLVLPEGVRGDVTARCEESPAAESASARSFAAAAIPGSALSSESQREVSGLLPYLTGECDLIAEPVSSEGLTYYPNPVEQQVQVEPGDTLPVIISYEAAPPMIRTFTASPNDLPPEGGEVILEWQTENTISVAVVADPDGGVGGLPVTSVRVPPGAADGRGTLSIEIPANSTVNSQAYNITLTARGAPGNDPASREAAVLVKPGRGELALTISGLPEGIDGEVNVARSGETVGNVVSSVVLTLPPDKYEVSANAVTVTDSGISTTYQARVVGSPAVVQAGATGDDPGSSPGQVAVIYNQVFEEEGQGQ